MAKDKTNKNYIRNQSYWGEVFFRLRKNKMAMLSLYILVAIILLCIIIPIISPYEIQTTNLAGKDQSPNSKHLLGTDLIGRDLFTRLFYAGRISLGVALAVVAIECVIGVVLGSLSGFYGGIIDGVIMRIAEIFMSFPFMIITITIVAVFGNSIFTLILVLALLSWPSIARIVRGQILSLREMEYMEACEALGISDIRRIFR
ncbi:MAG TPA: ABC transporter permease, partial [Sedimentibacter sp.]|nr:ABC transporter permease [Sedimentibacter sp.]